MEYSPDETLCFAEQVQRLELDVEDVLSMVLPIIEKRKVGLYPYNRKWSILVADQGRVLADGTNALSCAIVPRNATDLKVQGNHVDFQV